MPPGPHQGFVPGPRLKLAAAGTGLDLLGQVIITVPLLWGCDRTDKDFALASRLVVFLAFVPHEHTDTAFEALSIHVCTSYPELMQIVNYFEQNYLGLEQPDGTRTDYKYSIKHWNHYAMVLVDPDYPRTSNMVEGFHPGFNSKVNRPKPSEQEYFRAIRDQQVTTDYHLDRLAHGMTPAKKRKNLNHVLYDMCEL